VSGPKPSRSARGVAAERALLTEMGVLDDPYALRMLGRPMTVAHHLLRRRPQVVPTLPLTLAGLAARVRWHDAQVLRALDAGVRQVAVVGAGYDSRAWRLQRDGVRFFELDGAATQADKRQKASRFPGPGPTYVEADLRDRTAAEALVAGGLDPEVPAIFVLEGLTMYLTEEVVRRQLRALADAGAAGSRLATDFYPPPAAAANDRLRRQDRVQRLFRSGSGEVLRLQVDRPAAVALVEACGWHVDEAVGGREAGALVPRGSGLPLGALNEHKTLLAASRETSAGRARPAGAEGAPGAARAPPPEEDGGGRVHDGLDARGREQDVGAVTGTAHAEHAPMLRSAGRPGEWQVRPRAQRSCHTPDARFLPGQLVGVCPTSSSDDSNCSAAWASSPVSSTSRSAWSWSSAAASPKVFPSQFSSGSRSASSLMAGGCTPAATT
jgi:methyltransferase (TIGR00027 family)